MTEELRNNYLKLSIDQITEVFAKRHFFEAINSQVWVKVERKFRDSMTFGEIITLAERYKAA